MTSTQRQVLENYRRRLPDKIIEQQYKSLKEIKKGNLNVQTDTVNRTYFLYFVKSLGCENITAH